MGDAADYKAAQSTGNRLRNRCAYDYGTIHSLLDSCPVLHVSFNALSSSEPFPVILPMLGATGVFSDPSAAADSGPRSIYLHGHAASRFMKVPATAAAEGGEGEGDEGVPVCVAATFVDGLVLAYSPFHNSCNYRSVVAFGRAVAVTDEAERVWAMTLITDNMLPGRWADSREPSKPELTSTGILRVDIRSASAKVRVGSTGEDRKDLKDEALRGKTWVGVLPSSAAWGVPVPSKDNRVAEVPDYIANYITEQNREAKEYSEEAIQKG